MLHCFKEHMHGFCDASEAAYGAYLYIVSQYHDQKQSQLVIAKSRVAPLKVVTIPKLELCAAMILTDLLKKVRDCSGINFAKFTFWTDSAIVIQWINSESYVWKPFVSNIIAHIHENSKANEWRHVPSRENPADLISRGIDSKTLSTTFLWWHGPSWLSEGKDNWPIPKFKSVKNLPEKRPKYQLSAHVKQRKPFSIIQKYSSISRLQRIIALLLRFKHNGLNKSDKYWGQISITELEVSLNTIVKIVQNECFQSEISQILKGNTVKRNSNLISLNPFLKDGILRVGGRIKNADFSTFSQRHPILLPSDHHITTCIIRDEHYKNLHAGPQLLLLTLRTRF
ncbi:uncharacterized protein [Diabrotica undecimpunctata]|uniref:uncharacterized protein n=1 Tax=Diabrotica undecimpunctata TaxID=50387 RepID=UPI003B6421F1